MDYWSSLFQWVLISGLFISTIGQDIYMYELSGHKGGWFGVSISQCNDLRYLINKVSSVQTNSHCARLYDDKNCQGRYIEIPSGATNYDLHDLNFANMTESVGPCAKGNHSCSAEVTGNIYDQDVNVVIFSRSDFKGRAKQMDISGCTLIPDYFINQTRSVKTNGHCIQLYNNTDCQTDGRGVDSIELQSGGLSYNNISNWKFPVTKAISHCGYKCSERNTSTSASQVALILFQKQNYGGHFLHLNLEPGLCHDLTGEWEGAAMSANVGNQNCVTLYELHGCRGERTTLETSQPSLTSFGMNERSRSVRSCLRKKTSMPSTTTTSDIPFTTTRSVDDPATTTEKTISDGSNQITEDNASRNINTDSPSLTMMGLFVLILAVLIILALTIGIFIGRKYFNSNTDGLGKLSSEKQGFEGCRMEMRENIYETVGNPRDLSVELF